MRCIAEFDRTVSRFYDYMRAERKASDNTIIAYRSDMSFWKKHCEAHNSDPLDVTEDSVQLYRAELQTSSLSQASVHRRIVTLRAFARFLYNEGIVDNLQHIKCPAVNHKEQAPEVITEEELQRIINACEDGTVIGRRDRALIELAYGAGMTSSELCFLRLSDLDFENDLLHTENKKRAIPIVGALKRTMSDYLSNYRPLLDKRSSEFVFLSRNGLRLDREYLWVMLRKRSRQAGLSDVRPRALRNTFAAHLLNSGMSPTTLQELLGTSSVMSTEKYAHLDMSLRDYYDKYHPRAK